MTFLYTRTVVVALVVACMFVPAAGAQQMDGLAHSIERAKQATVGILEDSADMPRTPRQAQIAVRGTGVHLGDGYILTARHVVERPERGATEATLPQEIRVLTNTLEELPARLSSGSAFLDLVMYQVPSEMHSSLPAQIRFTDKDPEPGQDVFTVGYPLGWGPAIAFGRIGNPNTFLPSVDTRLLQGDLSVCSGNSGGGLFTSGGELIGVMHAIIQTERGKEALGNERCSRFAFAVPTALAKRIVQAVRDGKQPTFARLGIRMNAIKEGRRWLITAGDVSGPALAAGIKKGDAILAIDGIDLKDPAHLKNHLMERTDPGQVVKLKVRRGDKEHEISVTLGGS